MSYRSECSVGVIGLGSRVVNTNIAPRHETVKYFVGKSLLKMFLKILKMFLKILKTFLKILKTLNLHSM